MLSMEHQHLLVKDPNGRRTRTRNNFTDSKGRISAKLV
jgi:hypothetical protein